MDLQFSLFPLTVKIFDSYTGECKQILCGHDDCFNSGVLSADGSSVLTASYDKTAKIWDGATGECKHTLTGHLGALTCLQLSADESLILQACYMVFVYCTATGTFKQGLYGHENLGRRHWLVQVHDVL